MKRHIRATFSTFLPFSFFLSFFNHCLQFPTFFSVTWATNQVPGSWAAARLEGFEPNGLLTLHSGWMSMYAETPQRALFHFWYSTAAPCGGYSHYSTQWDRSAYFDTHSSPCRSVVCPFSMDSVLSVLFSCMTCCCCFLPVQLDCKCCILLLYCFLFLSTVDTRT